MFPRRANILALTCLVVFVAAAPSFAVPSNAAFTIEVQQGPGGSVVPSGLVKVAVGGTQQIVFVPDACHVMGGLQVDGVDVGLATSYTFTNVQADHELYVAFTLKTFNVTVSGTAGVVSCAAVDTLTAHVPATAGGEVRFYDGGTLIKSMIPVDGVAQAPVIPPLALGAHTITARYTSPVCGSVSESDPYDLEVVPDQSGAITATLTNITGDQPVYVTSVGVSLDLDGHHLSYVQANVDLYLDDAYLTAFLLTNGAGIASAPISPGPHTLRAKVTAPYCVPPTWSNEVHVTGRACGTQSATASLTANRYIAYPGQTITLLASVAPAGATGSVLFHRSSNGQVIAQAALVNGQAEYSLNLSTPGSYAYALEYQGNPDYECAYDGVTITVVAPGTAPSTLTLDATPLQVEPSAPFTLTATVAPAPPPGFPIEFRDEHGLRVEVPMNGGGQATLPQTLSTLGARKYRAYFYGSGLFAASDDFEFVEVLSPQPVPRLVSSPNPSKPGEPVTFRALLEPFEATGTVTFTIDEVAGSPIAVSGGRATYAAVLAPGVHSVSARYSGDALNASNVLYQTVTNAAPTALRVLAPNGGETVVVGTTAELRWTPVSPLTVPLVDLSIQRTPSSAWESLGQVANTGSYAWLVTEPGSNSGSTPARTARFAVADPSASVPSDTSDTEFWLSDASTLPVEPVGTPARFALGAPRPNPARGSVSCELALPVATNVRLDVLDVAGRVVARLIDGERPAGRSTVTWDARNAGRPAPPGVYMIRFKALETTLTRTMLIVR